MKGIIISGSNTIKREIVPSGTHIAVCYSMIHIGNVEWEYQGEKKIFIRDFMYDFNNT